MSVGESAETATPPSGGGCGSVLLGAAMCFALFTAGLGVWYTVGSLRLPALKAAPSGPPALTHDGLVAAVAPKLQEFAREVKPEVLDECPNSLFRFAVNRGYPVGVRSVPRFTKAGIVYALDEFGRFSISDMIALLEHHLSEKAKMAGPNDPVDPADGRLLSEIREMKQMAEASASNEAALREFLADMKKAVRR